MPGPAAVAASGGGDSMALLHLASAWGASRGAPIWAVTFDHGLRPDSGHDADFVETQAGVFGLPVARLAWTGPKPLRGVQAAARQARYRGLCRWATSQGVSTVLLGHTQDDLAETFVARAGRGAGLVGLAAMRDSFLAAAGADAPVRIVRPLLHASRDDLRHFLTSRGASWREDPSNSDDRFERVRIREAIGNLEHAGVSAARMARSAEALAAARRALEARVARAADELFAVSPFGFMSFDRVRWARLEDDVRRAVLAAALQQVSGSDAAPRAPRLDALVAVLPEARASLTLHGCVLTPWRGRWRIVREPRALAVRLRAAPCPHGGFWDRRFAVPENARVAPLGRAGREAAHDLKDLAPPQALETLPAEPAPDGGAPKSMVWPAGDGPAKCLVVRPDLTAPIRF